MKKNQTRTATALAATLLLSAHVVSAQEATQPNPESGKPGFFRQLGKSLKDAGGQMIGVKPTGPVELSLPAMQRSTPRSAGPERSRGCSNPITTSSHNKAGWTGPAWR